MNGLPLLYIYFVLGFLSPAYAVSTALHFAPQHIHPGQAIHIRTHSAKAAVATQVFLNPALPYIQQEIEFTTRIRHHVVSSNAAFVVLENNDLIILQPNKQKNWLLTS